MLLFADYETYYADDYTLRKMTPAEYILDKRFQVHGMAKMLRYKGVDAGKVWIDGDHVGSYFKGVAAKQASGHKITMVTFNALFDMCITKWVYGFMPDLMIDVMGMYRALFGPAVRRHSLAAMSEHLELTQGLKGDVIHKVKNMRTEQIKAQPMLWQEFIAYAKQDINLTAGGYDRMLPMFPAREFAVMDLVLRCAVHPQFLFDKPLLEQHLADVKAHKADLLATCGLTLDEDGKCPELMSTPKFKTLLESVGVVVEEKTSPTGKQIPALAKTDQFMQDLLENDDEAVAALAAARLGLKSTIEETRAQRFISVASLPDAIGYVGGSAPMPLRYGAAHTHRLGGDWKLNVQNLSAGRNGASNALRRSIKARQGFKIITADEAQIEARLSATVAGERTLLREFTEKLDPYGQLGGAIFGLGRAADKKRDPVERFIGKTGILGLGYGAGAPKFHTMVNSMARVSIPPELLTTFEFTEQMALRSVSMYRARYHRMQYTWNVLNTNGLMALTGNGPSFCLPPVVIKRGVIWAPNGQRMIYPDLTQDQITGEWSYQSGNERHKIYGAKLLENITQWLARIVVMEAAVRLYHRHKLRMALQAHDELVFMVPEADVTRASALIKMEMETRPAWAPDLPLEVEIGVGDTYGDAK